MTTPTRKAQGKPRLTTKRVRKRKAPTPGTLPSSSYRYWAWRAVRATRRTAAKKLRLARLTGNAEQVAYWRAKLRSTKEGKYAFG